MHIAVTGANGSIGRRVVLLALQRGHTVLGIDTPLSSSSPTARLPSHTAFSSADALTTDERIFISSHPQYTFIPADLKSYTETHSILSSTITPLDALVHMAGVPMPKGEVEAHNTNVVISWNVLHACATLGIHRVALASSVNATGIVFNETRRFDYLPLDEEHPCRPDEQYGLSKLYVLHSLVLA
jgi:nucleoside-diphosphate-sugar epimerase